ncbi:hypothetical protein G7054_g7816 [Neopestalotiopsis clavispora]|nr:hypothetical protein G7054_g7816 [Neopestalotiopsis clavispora]
MEALHDRTLCDRCSAIDFSPLTAPLPASQEGHRERATIYEEKMTVYIHDFKLDHAKSNHQCGLCNLLVDCARRTGEEHALDHKAVCIRPKLAWLADVDHASQSRQGTRLHRTGQLCVWFHELKHYQKLFYGDESDEEPEATMEEGGDHSKVNQTRLRARFQRNITLKSAAASWMLDIVEEHSGLSPCNRIPIAPHADKTVIRNWLSKCDQDHSHSPNASDSASRIIEVIKRKLLRVINTFTGDIETLSSLTDFVALSYVWGGNMEQGQALKALPIMAYAATIRDAAMLAQSLGFDWLWVDRICIDQNSEEEKAALIPYIKDIFAASSLTIVAASGSDAHFGLPGSPCTAREGEMPLRINPRMGHDGDVLRLLPAQPSFNALLNGSVWRTRGWTFEEEVFSRRLLYIFPTEMFFSCNTGSYRESTVNKFVPEPLGSSWSDSGATPPLIAAELRVAMQTRRNNSTELLTTRQFVRAVEEYTSRNLTIEEDRVEAFAGLITASVDVGDKISEVSLLRHGHPLSFFETALTWHPVSDPPTRLPANGKPFTPSWSWASAGSKVHFLDNGEEDTKSNWFRYEVIGMLEILGLPLPANDLVYPHLGYPKELIDSKPWLKKIRIDAPPSYLAATQRPAVVHPTSRVLPILHLITIVFEAGFFKVSEGVHSIISGTRSGTFGTRSGIYDTRITGHWATNCSFESGLQKFAVVASNANTCIMALKKNPSEDCFSRMGLLRVAWYNTQDLIDIMSVCDAQWEYIRLI